VSDQPHYPHRLIEVDLPIARISAHARREKSIRHGHISTLHIWWARRPLAACRAVICAALWPDPADEHCPQSFREAAAKHLVAFAKRVNPEKITDEKRELQETLSPESRARWEVFAKNDPPLDPTDPAHQNVLRFALLDFIADFANWDNSTVPAYLETSRALTQAAHEALGGEPGTRPLVVDPFAGGGSIPLEALRIGADAFASDLNPVAVLLNKVVLEYIPKYGQKLADEVRKWGQWIKEQAEKELAEFYPNDPDGATPIAYLWARNVLSEAPGQGAVLVEVPLIRSMWLAKKKGRNRALRWVRDKKGEIQTELVSRIYADGVTRTVRQPLFEIFEPAGEKDVERGTSSGGSATCPISGFTLPVERVRAQMTARQGGGADSRLLCVVTIYSDRQGRSYRLPSAHDLAAEAAAGTELRRRLEQHTGNLPLVPDGELNHLRGFFNVVLYGMTTWGKLFTPRQLLALTTLARHVCNAGTEIESCSGSDLATATQTCLAMALGKQADSNSSLCAWRPTSEDVGHTFGRQALPMMWDFAEPNVFSGATRDWLCAVEGGLQAISSIDAKLAAGQVVQASATAQPLPDGSASATVTDPPYYAAVPYADLSDFFYSWFRRSLLHRHPDLLSSPLTPKDEECVALSHRAAMYRHKDGVWFESMMRKACVESCRVTSTEGIGIFVFASKETPAWEAMLAALVDSKWIVTASWPVDTEMGARLRAKNSAVLASSVHIVARPRATVEIGDWREVLVELPKRLHEWLPRLASEGVVGADAIFACLGPALEIFSRYDRVERANGDPVLLKEYLEHVWAAVSKEALSVIFRDADASGLEPDARLTAMWLWTIGAPAANGKPSDNGETDDEGYGDEDEGYGKTTVASGFTLEFDAARKIAQGLGIHLERSESIVEVKGDKARLLAVAERTKHLFGKDTEAGQAGGKRSKKKPKQPSLFDDLEAAEEADGGWKELKGPPPGTTVLDRLHQSMILFGAQRGEMLKRFLVEDGVGKDARFWKLAQSLAALYPPGTDERRWVEGVLARKKALGL
jgi:putative DNA methylase